MLTIRSYIEGIRRAAEAQGKYEALGDIEKEALAAQECMLTVSGLYTYIERKLRHPPTKTWGDVGIVPINKTLEEPITIEFSL